MVRYLLNTVDVVNYELLQPLEILCNRFLGCTTVSITTFSELTIAHSWILFASLVVFRRYR